jgi:transposase
MEHDLRKLMPAPRSKDLRIRVVEAHHAGKGSYQEIAELFNVGEASVSRWLRLAREKKDVREPCSPGGGFPPRISPEEHAKLSALVAENPDRTVDEL